MKIVHVIWARFPVDGYGGTERVAYWLGKAQAELGHEVTYLCLDGSRLPFARTAPLPREIDDLNPFIPRGTDIVQLYGTPNYKIDAPFLVNIGGNGRSGEKFHPNTVFVSANHAARHGWTEYVHNGVDLAEYPLERRKDSYALFLAKASWRVKNLKGAIAISRAAGMLLNVAGGRTWFWKRGVASHGTVAGEKKLRLLQGARALLFPVIWEEPFGISVVEALACGTPVVATPRGALPEIISQDCGVIANTFDGLVEGLRGAHRFDPAACRARVENGFTHVHMAQSYLAYYKKIISDGKLRDGNPQAPVGADPQQLIYYEGYRT